MDIHLLKKLYDNANAIVTYKNSDLEILYCNKFTLEFTGYKDMKDIECRTDYDLPWARYADMYVKHEKNTLRHSSNIAIWPTCDFKKNNHVIACQRMLVECQKEKGVLTHASILKGNHNLELVNLIEKKSGNTEEVLKLINEMRDCLTARESECLFFLLRGKNAKTISPILKISSRTVESHIESLRHKFCCSYKSELVEKAIEMGFFYYIPESLF